MKDIVDKICNTAVSLAAIGGVVLLVSTAMEAGIDGAAYMSGIAIIGLIAGVKLKDVLSKK